MPEVVIHEAAYQEITTFLKEGQLFLDIPDLHAIRSIPALIIDTLVDVDKYRDPDWEGSMIKLPYAWIDILSYPGKEQYDVTNNWPREFRTQVSNRMRDEFVSCWEMNHTAKPRAVEILGDLGEHYMGGYIDTIIRHRVACGIVVGHFFETLWNVIQWGGFPSGWVGGEDGMLVVYVSPFHWRKAIQNGRI